MGKLAFFIVFIVFFQNPVLGENEKTFKKEVKKEKVSSEHSYSFRPLLIQGKKRVSRISRDLNVEGENIVGSETFFIEVNFKDRIFE